MAKEDHIVDDAPFDVPEFDEKEYIRKELIGFKQTLVLFFLSIAVAGVSFALWTTGILGDGRFPLQLMLAVVLGVLALPFLLRLIHVNVKTWKRKDWFGTMLLYMFFWLGFFLLFVNPPVTDAAAPVIETAVSPRVQSAGAPIHFGAYIADNVGVQRESIRFCVKEGPRPAQPPSELTDCNESLQHAGDAFWNTTITRSEPGEYTWYLAAMDANGQQRLEIGTFNVTDPLRAEVSPNMTLSRSSDRINVQVHAGLRHDRLRVVQFSLDGTNWHDMRPDPTPEKAELGWWTTDPSYKGWTAGGHDIRFRALDQPVFLRHESAQVGPTPAQDAEAPTRLTVASDYPDLGTVEPPARPEHRYIPPGATPGLGLPALLAAAVLGAVLWRSRRDA